MDLTEKLKALVLSDISKGFSEVTPKEYASMKYPRLIPMMRFGSHLLKAEGYGHLFLMETSAMGGAMKLLTLSFMPDEGGDLPYLLIDTMSMKNKSLSYVEYYDCTGKDLYFESLSKIKEKYRALPDYDEKDAWYIKERMPVSLIKGGEGADEDMLYAMAEESIRAYMDLAKSAAKDPGNIKGLLRFRERMLKEGNPSSATMEKVLGKEGAKLFFTTCVMPVL